MTSQTELPWIAEAKQLIGLREIVGVKHNAKIVSWLKDLKSAWLDDETPLSVLESNPEAVYEAIRAEVEALEHG